MTNIEMKLARLSRHLHVFKMNLSWSESCIEEARAKMTEIQPVEDYLRWAAVLDHAKVARESWRCCILDTVDEMKELVCASANPVSSRGGFAAIALSVSGSPSPSRGGPGIPSLPETETLRARGYRCKSRLV